MSNPETISDDFIHRLLAEIHVLSQGEVVLRSEKEGDGKEEYLNAVAAAKGLNQEWAKHAINGDIEPALQAMENIGWIQRGEYNSWTAESIVCCMRVVSYVQNVLWKPEERTSAQHDAGGFPKPPAC